MTSLSILVILTNADGQRVSNLSRDPATSLTALLAEVLAEHGLTGGVADWEARCRDVLLGWERTLDSVLQEFGPPLVLVVTSWRISSDRAPESLGKPLAPAPGGLPPTLSLPAPALRPGAAQSVPMPMPRSVGAPARSAPAQVERRATVRYYSRMHPERLFPLLVVISREAIQKVVKKAVEQAQSAGFQVAAGSVVEVEPILPGCNVFPPRDLVTIGDGLVQTTFWVVPHMLGKVQHARVVLRQDGKILAEVPLKIKVVKQTAAIVTGLLSLVLPYGSKAMQHFGLDWETQQEQGFVLYAWLAQLIFGVLRPEVLGGLLLLLTVVLYFAMRPRRREVFWDIEPEKVS